MEDGVDVVEHVFGTEGFFEVACAVGNEFQVEARREVCYEFRCKVCVTIALRVSSVRKYCTLELFALRER